jgi:hypothetical protein
MSQGNQGQKPSWAQGSSGGWGQQGGNQGWGGQQGTQGTQGWGQPTQPNQGSGQPGTQGNQGWGQPGTQGNQGWGQPGTQGTGNQGWGGQQGTGNQGFGGQQGFNPQQQQQQQQQPVTSLFDQNRDYMIFTALDDDYALDVSQGNDSSKYKIILWKKHGEKNQRFRIKPVAGTSKYQIYSNLGATV